jgi:hypothetical protein
MKRPFTDVRCARRIRGLPLSPASLRLVVTRLALGTASLFWSADQNLAPAFESFPQAMQIACSGAQMKRPLTGFSFVRREGFEPS